MPEGSNTITLASRDSQGNCNVLQWTLPRGGHDLPLYSVWVVGTWSIRFCSCCSLLLLAPSASTFIYVKLFSYFCMKLLNSANMQEKREPHETYTCVHDHILFVILTFLVYFQVLSAHFRAYIQALEKLQMDIATSTDLLGVETRSTGFLFSIGKESLKTRSSVFALGERINILKVIYLLTLSFILCLES